MAAKPGAASKRPLAQPVITPLVATHRAGQQASTRIPAELVVQTPVGGGEAYWANVPRAPVIQTASQTPATDHLERSSQPLYILRYN